MEVYNFKGYLKKLYQTINVQVFSYIIIIPREIRNIYSCKQELLFVDQYQ